MAEQQENLFPTLGEVASRTEALPDVDDNDVRLDEEKGRFEQEEGEEREMQEIESLCMRCHENVRLQTGIALSDEADMELV